MSKHSGSKLKPVMIAICIAVIILTAGIIVYLNGIGASEPDNTESVNVSIPSGSGASAIVEILDEKGLVKNKFFAKIHIRIGGYDTLQANNYIFSKSMALP